MLCFDILENKEHSFTEFAILKVDNKPHLHAWYLLLATGVLDTFRRFYNPQVAVSLSLAHMSQLLSPLSSSSMHAALTMMYDNALKNAGLEATDVVCIRHSLG